MKQGSRTELQRLGRTIRSARNSMGLSQEELANRSGLDRSYVGGIERGERNLSFINLVKITRGLAMSLDQLLARFEDEHGD